MCTLLINLCFTKQIHNLLFLFHRNSSTVLLHELKGFEAPDFMLKKVKKYMNHIKPQPLEDSESPSDTSPGVSVIAFIIF